MAPSAAMLSTSKRWMVVLLFSACAALGSSVAAGQDAAKTTEQQLSALLSKSLGRSIDLVPRATVDGCVEASAPEIVGGPDKELTIRRQLREKDGENRCTLVERFRAGSGSVRWEIEVQGSGAPWSQPIVAAVRYPAGRQTRYWMAWETGGTDPMVPVPLEKSGVVYSYGAPRWRLDRPIEVWNSWSPFFRRPHNERYVSIPIATWIEPGQGGLSLAASPEPMQFDLEIAMEKDGQARFQWFRHRLAKNAPPVKLALDLVAHEDDWRSAMRWMVDRYRDYFEPPIPAVRSWVGCGQYARARTDLDVESLKRMDFTLNWNAEFDWPYMGMFVPPVRPGQQWTAWHKQPTDFARIEAYAAWMKARGFHVLQYFNLTEFGSQVVFPRRSSSDRNVWKEADWRNCDEFLAARLWAAVVRVPERANLLNTKSFFGSWGKKTRPGGCFYISWDDEVVVDCGEPVYRDFILDQAQRVLDVSPSDSGICIDRVDWTRLYNLDGDDGVSWFDGAPARSLTWSWCRLMDRMGPMFHDRGKTIFANGLIKRLDLMRHVDCIFDEFSDSASMQGDNWLCLRKPVVVFHGLMKKDAEFQNLLHWGIYPQVPCPGNDHGCRYGTPEQRKIYEDFGPLLKLMRGRMWVLQPHCITVVEGEAQANLFEVPDGWVAPVTHATKDGIVKVAIRNVPGITAKLRMTALHPGASQTQSVSAAMNGRELVLTVPVKRGCAMVKIEKRIGK